jgi:glycosyltransferase involved in cell wall biosynthesis
MAKRVLIFSLVYYPRFVGGAEVAVKEITDRISDVEFDMVTLRKHAPNFERIGNVNVYRVGWPWVRRKTSSSKIFPLSKYTFPFFAFFKALSLHRKNKYDAIWSIMANYAGFGALFFKNRHSEVPFILTLQEGDPTDYIEKRVSFLYPVFKKIFTKADKVQAISSFLASWGNKMGHESYIDVIPNGVDIERFENKNPQSRNDGNIVLITTSRLVKKNGLEDVIRSLKLLPENVRFKILGTGPLKNHLIQITKVLNLENRVEFADFVDQKDMPPHLHAADIFIRPSLSEGMGNSFIEAMAARLPVIATPVGGIPDFLKDGETGLFCKVNDPEDIAKQVTKLANDPALVERLKENALKMVQERYDWNLVAGEMKTRVFDKV